MELGKATAADTEQLARDLHTLKGDARIVGLSLLGQLVHDIESLMLGSPRVEGRLPAMTNETLLQAMGVVSQYLKNDFEDQEAADIALEEAIGILEASGAQDAPVPRALPAPPNAVGSDHAPVVGGGGRASDPKPDPKRWMQVEAARVDALCNQVSEFTNLFRALSVSLQSALTDGSYATRITRGLLQDIDACRSRLEEVTNAAWSLRLVPVEPTLVDLGGHARELASTLGRRVRVSVDAGGSQLERGVLDRLWDPFLHLVRNAVDHGLEPPEHRGDKPKDGLLAFECEPSGGSVLITIRDDGRGIDTEVVRAAAVARGLVTVDGAKSLSKADTLDLLFEHGFSTRKEVSDLSGRGVGLDVVRAEVTRLDGTVTVDSELGKGTRFTLRIPTTISKERLVVIAVADALFAIPSRYVVEVVPVDPAQLMSVVGGTAIAIRDENVPLLSFSDVLGRTRTAPDAYALVIEHRGRRWAFGTSAVVGEFDLVRRPVDDVVAATRYIGGSAALDDGRLVVILTVSGILQRASRTAAEPAPRRPVAVRHRVFIVDDSAIVRSLVKDMLAASGFEVDEAAHGREALERLEKAVPHLVISDVEMPIMDGFELLGRIRKKWSTLPVIMLTTRASDEDRGRALALGADAYVVKNELETTRLVDVVGRYVGRAR